MNKKMDQEKQTPAPKSCSTNVELYRAEVVEEKRPQYYYVGNLIVKICV